MSDIIEGLGKQSTEDLIKLRVLLIEQLKGVTLEVKSLIKAREKYGKDVIRVYFTKRNIIGVDTYNLESRTYFSNREDVFKEVEDIRDWEWKKRIKNMSIIKFIKFKRRLESEAS